MDIPVPKDLDEEKQAAAASPTEKTDDIGLKEQKKNDESGDDAQTKIAELLTSKKYHLAIKEKRTKPLLDFSLGIHKKHKKNIKSKQKAQKDKKPVSKSKQMIEVGVVAVLLIGLFAAIDTGMLDIGWKPPFTLFGNKQNEQVLNFTNGTANENK